MTLYFLLFFVKIIIEDQFRPIEMGYALILIDCTKFFGVNLEGNGWL